MNHALVTFLPVAALLAISPGPATALLLAASQITLSVAAMIGFGIKVASDAR